MIQLIDLTWWNKVVMLHAAFKLHVQNSTGMCNLLRKQNHANDFSVDGVTSFVIVMTATS